MALGAQLRRLGKHSAIYGLGGLVSRILAVLLLPLYTRYLSTSDYGKIETLVALTTVLAIVLRVRHLERLLPLLLRLPRTTTAAARVLRTSFWFTMAMATARPRRAARVRGADRSRCSSATTSDGEPRPRAAFVGLWAQMNYEQLTSLFRVEERSVAFVCASLANILITVGATVAARRRARQGPARRDRRQLHRHADRLPRAARLPARAARPPVRPRAPARDEPLRDAARAVRALPLDDELQRPLLPRQARRTRTRSGSTRSGCGSRPRWCCC